MLFCTLGSSTHCGKLLSPWTSYNLTHDEKYGSSGSKRFCIPSRTRDATFSTRAWAIQCLAAYTARGAAPSPVSSTGSRSRIPRQALAISVLASSRIIWYRERSSVDVEIRSDSKNSFTEKCENWTTGELSPG